MKALFKFVYRHMSPVLKWTNPFFDLKKCILAFMRYIGFFRDWKKYAKMPNPEPIALKNIYPCLHDKTSSTPFDSHYFYQDIWAFKEKFSQYLLNTFKKGNKGM